MKKILFFLIVLFSLEGGPIQVLVSVPPYAGVVKKLGAEEVDVTILVPKGADPHSYEPSPQQAMKVSKAEVWFRVGDPFEEGLLSLLKKGKEGPRIIDLRQGLNLIEVAPNSFDPHIWMSSSLLLTQAETIVQCLIAERPEKKPFFLEKLKAFQEEVSQNLEKNKKRFASLKGKIFLSDHPAYNYFCRDFGLTPLSLEEEGKEPTPKNLAQTFKTIKQEGVKVIFSQSQFFSKSVRTLSSELNLKIVHLDPLSPDFPEDLEKIAEKAWEALHE